eukprot:2413207-Amphidinium_carterae.1
MRRLTDHFSLRSTRRNPPSLLREDSETKYRLQTGSTREESVLLKDVLQTYPSPDGLLNGCGEGHLFALREFVSLESVDA